MTESKLLQSADYENKASYTFDITASDYYVNTILGGSNTKYNSLCYGCK